jgi:hypothetical protein
MDSERAVSNEAMRSLVFLSLILSPQATRISIAAERENCVSPVIQGRRGVRTGRGRGDERGYQNVEQQR